MTFMCLCFLSIYIFLPKSTGCDLSTINKEDDEYYDDDDDDDDDADDDDDDDDDMSCML